MSIDCWNRNACKMAFLNAKHCTSAAEREDSTREFCVALWYFKHPENADNNMIDTVVPYLRNCACVCADMHDFEVIANGMRNCYYDGYRDGYTTGFNIAEDEERG